MAEPTTKTEREQITRDAQLQLCRAYPPLSSIESFTYLNTIPRLIDQVGALDEALDAALDLIQSLEQVRG